MHKRARVRTEINAFHISRLCLRRITALATGVAVQSMGIGSVIYCIVSFRSVPHFHTLSSIAMDLDYLCIVPEGIENSKVALSCLSG